MPDLFVGRQPIFNRRQEVIAYELLYRAYSQAEEANFTDGDQATTQVILNAFSQFGLDSLIGDKKAFVNIPPNFLLGKYPIPMPPASVVLEVMENTPHTQPLLDALTALSQQGYPIALDDVTSFSQIKTLLPLAQIVKVDLPGLPRAHWPVLVSQLRPYRGRLKLLAEKVETREDFEYCKRLGFDYFQGYFLCRPSVVQGRRMDSARLVIMRSLAKIQEPGADFHSLGNLLAQDVTLSYKLLKLVNSAYYSLAQPITSIDQAVGLIGLNQLRGWLALLLLASVESKSNELTAIAMLRARMCELLARAMRQRETESFFLVGLFSVLDAMLDLPLEEALANLSLADEVVNGLLHHTGVTGLALQIVLAYERGDWDWLLKTNLQPEVIREDYLAAVRWSAEMGRSLEN